MKRKSPDQQIRSFLIPELTLNPIDLEEKKYEFLELHKNIQTLANIYEPVLKSYPINLDQKQCEYYSNSFDSYFWVLLKMLTEKRFINLNLEEKIYFENFADRKLRRVIKCIYI